MSVHCKESTLYRTARFAAVAVVLCAACAKTPLQSRADDRLMGPEGIVLAVIRGPVEFQMGSPENEVGREPASDSPDETRHHARIPRSFAIGTHEITVAQFRRFLRSHSEVEARHAYAENPTRMAEVMQRFSPDENGPQIAVTWYEAAMFCNWLSAQEGLPPSEWVYPASMSDIRAGMRMPPDYLRRTGYRLPTEAEWEYATRAGTSTSRFFGDSDSLLGRYAWYSRKPPRAKNDPVDPNDPQRTYPVGRLAPNPFGLFDVYGNVWEWTQSRIEPYPVGTLHVDVEDDVLVVTDSAPRGRRGGAFSYGAAFARSASRGTVSAFPFLRRDNVGFRVARTIR